MPGRKCWRVQLFLLFCRFSCSQFFRALLRYNTACASVIDFHHKLFIIENSRLKKQTRRQKFEFIRQGFNRKQLVICSINHFYTTLTGNIAVLLRLWYSVFLYLCEKYEFQTEQKKLNAGVCLWGGGGGLEKLLFIYLVCTVTKILQKIVQIDFFAKCIAPVCKSIVKNKFPYNVSKISFFRASIPNCLGEEHKK